MKAATGFGRSQRAGVQISIHAAREGGDKNILEKYLALQISIHAAREGGDGRVRAHYGSRAISIHAAREGGDQGG